MRGKNKVFEKFVHYHLMTYENKYFLFFGGFDPGSGLTLAACLSHASRTESSIVVIQ